jgi:hypothetical protein
MKRNALIAAFATVIIIIIIILGFKSCNPRTKIVSSDAEVYSAFINANIEFTCMVMKDIKLAENTPENHKKLDEVYAKHKLPVENNYQMLGILQKYSNDEGVTAIIQQNSENCLTGGSPIFYQATAN